MTNQEETVAVPVELLKDWSSRMSGFDHGMADEMRAVLPKPKPRFVAVDLRKWNSGEPLGPGGINELPELLTLLDSILADEVMSPELRASIRYAFCAALGVTNAHT